jgi:hypothetical protein
VETKTYNSYIAYGLGIHSAISMPELIATNADCDVTIKFGEVKYPSQEEELPEHTFYGLPGEMYLYWKEVATFMIRNGNEIIIDPIPNAEESRMRLFLLGAAMGVLLHQRGYFVLHSSAVSIEGQAVAFVADKGWGKSTMAANMHLLGHELIADDVVALDWKESSSPMVLPSFPQLKLWPDSVVSIGEDPEDIPRISVLYEKRDRLLKSGFATTPLPLKHIYVLSVGAEGSEIEIEKLSPQEALLNMVSNAYANRYGNQLLQGQAASAHFQKCTEISKTIPIFRLKRPASLELVPTVAKLVQEHVLKSSIA